MVLEGVVTNVANFGAFIDIGVHQDGLVHISMLSQQFVKDPRDVVKAGDIVKVKVLEVDVPRQRISLTMRMDDQPGAANAGASAAAAGARAERGRSDPRGTRDAARGKTQGSGTEPQAGGTFANLFANARNLKKR
jgi:protein Tex